MDLEEKKRSELQVKEFWSLGWIGASRVVTGVAVRSALLCVRGWVSRTAGDIGVSRAGVPGSVIVSEGMRYSGEGEELVGVLLTVWLREPQNQPWLETPGLSTAIAEVRWSLLHDRSDEGWEMETMRLSMGSVKCSANDECFSPLCEESESTG